MDRISIDLEIEKRLNEIMSKLNLLMEFADDNQVSFYFNPPFTGVYIPTPDDWEESSYEWEGSDEWLESEKCW